MIQAHPWAGGDSQGFFEVSFEETFRQAVAAYRRDRRLSEMAVGDSGPAVSLASCGESVAEDDPGLLTTRQTAAQVGLSPRTLERFRVTGQGPRFLKLGRRVRYAREDIEYWLKGCVRRSTSDDGDSRRAGATGA